MDYYCRANRVNTWFTSFEFGTSLYMEVEACASLFLGFIYGFQLLPLARYSQPV